MKNENTIKAIFLPKNIREQLHVSPNEFVDIIYNGKEFVLRKRIQNSLNEIGAILNSEASKLGTLTEEEAINFAVNFRHEKN